MRRILMLWIKKTIGTNNMYLTMHRILNIVLFTLSLWQRDVFLNI